MSVDPYTLAAQGYSIFPVQLVPNAQGKITKPPQRGIRWRDESTRDPATIAGWLECWPDTYWAIDCGASGIVALDLDPGCDLDAVAGVLDGDPATGPYRTPRGGTHLIYKEARDAVIGNSDAGLGLPHVDVRGMGGYVVAYGSVPAVEELHPLPVTVLQRLRGAAGVPARDPWEAAPGPPAVPVTGGVSGVPLDPFSGPARGFTREQANALAARVLAGLQEAPEGTRNATLNAAAVSLGHLVAAGAWPEEQVSARLAAIAEAIGLDRAEIGPTIRSGMRRGMREPYQLLPEPGSEWSAPAAGDGGEDPEVDAMLAEMLTAEQLAKRPNPTPLIAGLLDLDTLAWLIGKSGSYKSFLALDWAGHVAAGRAWLGRACRPAPVVYLVGEGLGGSTLRVRAWQEKKGPMHGVHFLPRPVQACGPEWAVLARACRRLGAGLIIADTQARVTVGIEENSNTDMGKFIDQLEKLRAYTGACVLVIHHIGRNGDAARGASAIDGAQGTELRIERGAGKLNAIIKTDKQKDMGELPDIPITLAPVNLGIDTETGRELSSLIVDTGFIPLDVEEWDESEYDADATNNAGKLLRVMRSTFSRGHGGTKAEVMTQARAVMGRASFYRAWNELIDRGLIVRVSGKQSFLPAPRVGGEES